MGRGSHRGDGARASADKNNGERKRSGERRRPGEHGRSGARKRSGERQRSGERRSGAGGGKRSTAGRGGGPREAGQRAPSEGSPGPAEEAPATPDYLPRGKPPPPSPADAKVREVVGELREACSACGYRRICTFAPAQLQIELERDPEARHKHERTLKRGLGRLSRIDGDWQTGLVRMLTGREKDALLAGCLLHVAWRRHPEPLSRLIAYTRERCDVDRLKEQVADASGDAPASVGGEGRGVDPAALQERMFRGQVLRIASFSSHAEILRAMQDLLILDGDEEERLFQYEAIGALSLLLGRRLPGDKWIRSLEHDATGPFRATFAARDAGDGAIDVFFPYRRGNKRSYLYLRRDREGKQNLSSVDKVRIDSLLYRMFLVFNTDALKTHRIFKELCRHVNVRAGAYHVDHILSGFDRLARDDLLLLGIYAPSLARAVGHYLEIEDFHHLVKFLYQLRSETGRRGEPAVPAHEKIVERRAEWEDLVDRLGADLIKDVFSVLFRLNASYERRVYTTPTYLKIGEVAYLLTAVSGWNPKGLEIELKQAKKPLAFVAYGLQPPGKWSRIRVGKLGRAAERAEAADKDEVARAAQQGQRYMSLLHGYASYDELAKAVESEDWTPPERTPSSFAGPVDADPEDFSDYAEDEAGESGDLDGVDPNREDADGEVFVVVEDEQTDERGRLITQRMRRQELDEDED